MSMCPVCAVLWGIVIAGGVCAATMPGHRSAGLIVAGSALALGAAIHYSKGMQV